MADEKKKKQLTPEEEEKDKKVQKLISPKTDYPATVMEKDDSGKRKPIDRSIEAEAETKGMVELGKLGSAVASQAQLKKYTPQDIADIEKEQHNLRGFKWWNDWKDIPKGIGNGGNNLLYSTSDFVLRHGTGGYLKPHKVLKLNPFTEQGEDPSFASGMISDVIQFAIPYGIVSKGMSARYAAKDKAALGDETKKLKAPGGAQRKWAMMGRGVAQALPVDFLAFHPHQGGVGEPLAAWWGSKTTAEQMEIERHYKGMTEFVAIVGGPSGADQREELKIMDDIERRFREMGLNAFAGGAFELAQHTWKAWRLNKYINTKANEHQQVEIARARATGDEVLEEPANWSGFKSLTDRRDALRKELATLSKEADHLGVQLNKDVIQAQRRASTPFTLDPSLDIAHETTDVLEIAPGLIKPEPKGMGSILDRPIREEEVQPRYYGDEPTDWIETGTKKSLGKDAPDKVFRGSSHQVTINEHGDLEIKPQTDDMWERNFPGEGTGTSVTSSSNEAADYALRSWDQKSRDLFLRKENLKKWDGWEKERLENIRKKGKLLGGGARLPIDADGRPTANPDFRLWLDDQIDGTNKLETELKKAEDALALDNPYVIEIDKEAWDRAVAGKETKAGTDSGEIRVVSEGSIIIKKGHWKKYGYKGEEGIYAARGAEPIGEGGLRAATKETTEEVAEEAAEETLVKPSKVGRSLFAFGDKHIYLDPEAIKNDWDNNLAYMKGVDKEAGFSALERAISDELGLDVSKLQNAFLSRVDSPEKGAEVYGKFLELRAKRIKEGFKKLDPTGKRFKNEIVNTGDPGVFRVLTEATYDALVKDLKISASTIQKTGQTMSRGGGIRETLINTKFDDFLESVNPDTKRADKSKYLELKKNIASGKVGAREGLSQLVTKGIFNPRLSTLQAVAPIDVTTSVLVDTVKDALGNKLTKKNNTLFLMDLLEVKRQDIHQGMSNAKVLDEALEKHLVDTAGSPAGAEKMLNILLRNEGVFKNTKHAPIVKEGVEIKDIASLSVAQKTELVTRMVSVQLAITSRRADLENAVQNYLSKPAGQRLPQDHLAMMLAADRMVGDMAATRELQADWTRMNLTMQEHDYNKYLYNTKMPDDEKKNLISRLLKTVKFGGKKGKKATDLLAVTIDKLRKTGDWELTAGDNLKLNQLTMEHIQKGHFSGYLTDIWISALLSGLRTSTANIVGTMGKSILMPVTKLVGSRVIRKKGRTTILGHMLDGPAAREYAKTQAWQQLVFMKDFTRKFWRLYMKSHPGDEVAGGAEQGYRNIDSAVETSAKKVEEMDRTLRGGITGAGLEATQLPEHFADAGSIKSIWGDVARKGGEAAEYLTGGKVPREKVYTFVDKVANFGPFRGLANGLDALYHSTLKQGLRKLVAFDEFSKNMMAYSYVRSSLATHATVARKLTDPEQINDFVLKTEKGMIMPNGELFSVEGLSNWCKREFDQLYGQGDIALEAWPKFRKDFFEQHADLHEGGVRIMTAQEREVLANKIRKEIEEATFTTKGGSVARELDELNDAKGRPRAAERKPFRWGTIAEGGESMVQSPFASLMVTPFARVTGNLFKELGTHLPGFAAVGHRFWADMASDDIGRASMAWGRQLVGGAFLTTAGYWAATGKITARGPTDPKEREAWRLLNKKPYCFTWPTGHQIEFARLDPHIGGFLSLAADLQENYYYARTDEEREFWQKDVSYALAQTFGEALTQKTYMKNMDELFEQIEMVDDTGNFDRLLRYGTQKAGSFMPNIVEGISGSIDPHQRKIRGMLDAVQYKLWPFGIPPKRHHIFGEILLRTETYPNPFIHAFTPVKIYKPAKDQAIEMEMVSLFSAYHPQNMYEAGSRQLNYGRSFAVIRPAELQLREGEKEIPKWRMDKWKKHSKTMRYHAKNFKAPGGALCPVSPGQDFYDFEQQYLSLRKVPFVKPFGSLLGTKDKPGILPTIQAKLKAWEEKMTPDQRKNHKDYQTHKAVEEWAKSMLEGDLNKPMSLREMLTAVISSPLYQAMPPEADTILQKKSLRLEIMGEIIEEFRADSRKELQGSPVTIVNAKGEQKTWDNGILSLFWKDLAIKRYIYHNQAAKRKSAANDAKVGGIIPTGTEGNTEGLNRLQLERQKR